MLKVRRFWKKALLMGQKTQTRRPWRRPFKAGSIHEVRPKRNASGFAWVQIARAWQERLGDISEADARAEGYPNRRAMLEHFCLTYAKRRAMGKSRAWWEQTLEDILAGRDRGPQVWAMEFHLVRPPRKAKPQG